MVRDNKFRNNKIIIDGINIVDIRIILFILV